MTLPAPTYDLVLLLDPQAEDTVRAKIVSDAVTAIEAQGDLVRQDDWGERALAYPIDRHASAEYHLLQFHVGQEELLEGLDRSLRITDGVLRHRIIKLKPGTPDAPNMGSSPPPPAAAVTAPAEAPVETPVAEVLVEEVAVEEAPAAEAPAAEAPAATPDAEPAPGADAS